MNDPLGLDPETMRRLGYKTVDILVDRLSAVAEGPVIRRADGAEMDRRLSEPPPEAGQGFDEILGRLGEDVLPFASVTCHPRYFAFIPGSARREGRGCTLTGPTADLWR